MKFAISSGHGKYIRGAAGSPVPPYLDEVDEARKVVDRTAQILKDGGVAALTFHDNTSHDQNTNLNTIVNWHNAQARDLDVSVHFNAYQTTSKAMGCEVLYVSQSSLAGKVSQAIADAGHFINRGPKKRTDLFFLNKTHEPAILLEVCFVDSKADADLYHQHFETICHAIAEAISGEALTAPPGGGPESEWPPAESASRPMLGKGDHGDDVAAVQCSLGLKADGDFGSITEAAVVSYQRACGVTADGIVGPQTWTLLDELDRRNAAGDDGIDEELGKAIDQAVEASGMKSFSWPDRGQAPPGYYSGMAKTFAHAVARLNAGDSAMQIMAQAATGNADKDALTYYAAEFYAKGMVNDIAGVATLRHLFVMMTGLGMRESSGNHWEGRDLSASNVQSDTCEAGLFQTSWNISSCSGEIKKLLDEYKSDPNAFRESFTVGLSPTTTNLDIYGSGLGAQYQWLARYSPAFTAFVTGIGLRLLRAHWGPIGRREVLIEPRVDKMLQNVQGLVANDPLGPIADPAKLGRGDLLALAQPEPARGLWD